MDRQAQRAWIAQWTEAAAALAAQRARELAELSDAAALAASDAVLGVALDVPLSPERLTGSGLVRQQQLLHRQRAK
jgi:hypothetical protein